MSEYICFVLGKVSLDIVVVNSSVCTHYDSIIAHHAIPCALSCIQKTHSIKRSNLHRYIFCFPLNFTLHIFRLFFSESSSRLCFGSTTRNITSLISVKVKLKVFLLLPLFSIAYLRDLSTFSHFVFEYSIADFLFIFKFMKM